MLLDLHRRAEELMAAAEIARRQGDLASSTDLYAEAARLEVAAYEATPTNRERTRGVLAVSAASLFERAGLDAAALTVAYRFLADGVLSEAVQDELLNLAIAVRQRQDAAQQGRWISAEGFLVSLRGEGVRAGGLIALDSALLKMEQFKNYAIRVGEWIAGQPFREKGPPAQEISQICIPLVSPAMVGSYQFELRLESAVQLQLFDATRARLADEISEQFYEILDQASSDVPEELSKRVQDARYEETFLKLVRNIAPTGRQLTEIEVQHARGDRTTVLRPEVRRSIQRRLDEGKQPSDRAPHRVGVLRALDLDHHWLVLVEEGVEQRSQIERGKVLDDVVGPLVNRRVRAEGMWRGGHFYVTDLVETDDQ